MHSAFLFSAISSASFRAIKLSYRPLNTTALPPSPSTLRRPHRCRRRRSLYTVASAQVYENVTRLCWLRWLSAWVSVVASSLFRPSIVRSFVRSTSSLLNAWTTNSNRRRGSVRWWEERGRERGEDTRKSCKSLNVSVMTESEQRLESFDLPPFVERSTETFRGVFGKDCAWPMRVKNFVYDGSACLDRGRVLLWNYFGFL